ncbi:MAG: efflux RND transporter permease subunit [Kiritimatiellia bacterium]
MSVARFAVYRPIFIIMLTLAVLILGAVALVRIPIDLMPDITYPTLSVSTSYANASPAEIEELITRPIEEALNAVPGVEEVSSSSAEGESHVSVSFSWGTDLDAAANDVRDRLDRVARRLPDEADRPILRKFDLASFPVLILGASGKMDPVQLRLIIDDEVKYRIERIPGVASLDVRGGLSREIHVLLDPDRVKALGIPLDQIAGRLRDANITLPAGSLESGNYELTVRTSGEFTGLDQLRDTTVAMRNGVPVRLGELAKVADAWQKIVRIVRVNGVNGVRLAVNKQSGKNTVEVAELVLKEIGRINAELPQIAITPIRDSSDYIRRSITNVGRAALYGGLYAMIVLLVFLRSFRSTIIIATAIPISIFATFMLIYFGGFTLNLMTLGGLALGVGMLVDNSIVVLENIYRLRAHEPDLGPAERAVKGAGEVTSSIIASTLTTLVVFLPLIFVRGMSGVMFRQLSYVVGFSLLCSMGAALTLLPMLAALFLKNAQPRPPAAPSFSRGMAAKTAALLERLESRYRNLLKTALDHRGRTAVIALLLLLGSLALIPLVGTELMPASDESEVRVTVEMEAGATLALLDKTVRPIEERLARVPEGLKLISGLGGSLSSQGDLQLILKPVRERNRSSDEIAAALRRDIGPVPGAVIRTRAGQGLFIMRMVSGSSDRVQVEIRGYDLDAADALATRTRELIETVDGVTDAKASRESGVPEMLITVDRLKAESMKVSVARVAGALQTTLGGTKSGSFRENGKEYDILLKLQDAETRPLAEILDLTISNDDGEPVVLRNIVEVKPRTGPANIDRKDQERVVYVRANIRGRDLGSVLKDIRVKLATIPIPQGFSIAYGGDFEEQQKAFHELALGLVLSLLLVYMVMACQFESVKDPLVVMFSVPFAIIGVVLTLLLTGTTFNVQSYIGCIMLGGIVVNNAILLVDQANRLHRREGLTPRAAIEEAGRRRLRPILMTALSTILGLLPLALGVGEGGEAQAPLARAVIGGLASSTLLTLFFIPVVYSLFEEGVRRKKLLLALLLAGGGWLAGPAEAAEATTNTPGIRLGEAVLMALEHNRSLEIQRLEPLIAHTFEEAERAAFDPALGGEVASARTRTFPRSTEQPETVEENSATAFASQQLSTGTRVGLEGRGLRESRDTIADRYSTGLDLTLTQALLQGRPVAVNLASLRQARLDVDISVYEFRGFLESLVAEVETEYWNCALARRRLRIYEEALQVAEQQLREIDHRIRVGSLPETERVSAQAEIALRREALINARSTLSLAGLRLLRLIDPAALAGPHAEPVPSTVPESPGIEPAPLADHVALALRRRPELNQVKLQIEKGDLEIVKTKNGLLPRLDLFARLGSTAYADSFGKAARDLDAGEPDYEIGLRFSFPPINREAKAVHRRAMLNREQADLSLKNLSDLVRIDVESAHIEVLRAREQIAATAITRQFQAEKLRVEQAKLSVGRSTGLLVAQAQQDLINSQVAEVESVVASLQALVRLFRLDGSLLERRGLAAPGLPPL